MISHNFIGPDGLLKDLDICKLPPIYPIRFDCSDHPPVDMWTFNARTEKCEQFSYKGCYWTTENLFRSKSKCQAQCGQGNLHHYLDAFDCFIISLLFPTSSAEALDETSQIRVLFASIYWTLQGAFRPILLQSSYKTVSIVYLFWLRQQRKQL